MLDAGNNLGLLARITSFRIPVIDQSDRFVELKLYRESKQESDWEALFPEIVHHHFFANPFEYLLDEVDVHGVHLVFVLGLLIWENDIESDLVGLINHRAFTGCHFPNVETQHTWNWLQILVCPIQ